MRCPFGGGMQGTGGTRREGGDSPQITETNDWLAGDDVQSVHRPHPTTKKLGSLAVIFILQVQFEILFNLQQDLFNPS